MRAGLRSAVVVLASIVMMVSGKYLSRGHAAASKTARWSSLASAHSARLSQQAAGTAPAQAFRASRDRPFGVRPPAYQIRTQFSGTARRSSSSAATAAASSASSSSIQPPSSSSATSPVSLSPLCSHSITSEELLHTLFIYTDGSCQGNRNVFQNACSAGWAAVAVRLTPQSIESLKGASLSLQALEDYLNDANCTEVVELFGGVVTPSEGPQEFSLGAVVGSNNTGELCAIGEALLFVKDSYQPVPKRVVVMFDSEVSLLPLCAPSRRSSFCAYARPVLLSVAIGSI